MSDKESPSDSKVPVKGIATIENVSLINVEVRAGVGCGILGLSVWSFSSGGHLLRVECSVARILAA